jgi:hypothetical protein
MKYESNSWNAVFPFPAFAGATLQREQGYEDERVMVFVVLLQDISVEGEASSHTLCLRTRPAHSNDPTNYKINRQS